MKQKVLKEDNAVLVVFKKEEMKNVSQQLGWFMVRVLGCQTKLAKWNMTLILSPHTLKGQKNFCQTGWELSSSLTSAETEIFFLVQKVKFIRRKPHDSKQSW